MIYENKQNELCFILIINLLAQNNKFQRQVTCQRKIDQ